MLNSSLIEFVLFGKRPVPGQVKTRLFPDNPQASCDFYKAFLKDFSIRYQENCNLRVRPLIDDSREEHFLTDYFDKESLLEPILQEEGTLFERLALGLSKVETPYFFLTGTDLPHFPFHYLPQVEIGKNQVTIGPDVDGGFYFFAGPKECAPLFNFKPKDKNIFLELTEIFEGAGFKVSQLKPWSDIDTAEDLKSCFQKIDSKQLPNTFDIFSREH